MIMCLHDPRNFYVGGVQIVEINSVDRSDAYRWRLHLLSSLCLTDDLVALF